MNASIFRSLHLDDLIEAKKKIDKDIDAVASFKWFSLPVLLQVRLPIFLPILDPTQSLPIALCMKLAHTPYTLLRTGSE